MKKKEEYYKYDENIHGLIYVIERKYLISQLFR